MTQYVSSDKKVKFDEVTLRVYGGSDGEYSLYEDDGISMQYQNGDCTRTCLRWNCAEARLEAEGVSPSNGGCERVMHVKYVDSAGPDTITIRY